MNTAEYVEHVYLRLSGGRSQAETGIERLAIEAQLSAALYRLSQRVYGSGRRALAEKPYTLTLQNGAVDLSHADFDDLVFEALRTAEIRYDDGAAGVELEFYEDPRDLSYPHPAGFYYYSLSGRTLIVRDERGEAPANANLTARLSFILTLATLPPHLEAELINIGVELAQESQLPAEVQREAEAVDAQ